MKSYQVKQIFKDNDLKKKIKVIFDGDVWKIVYKDENFVDEIPYNNITQIRNVSNDRVGVYAGNSIYGFFASEFASKLQYKKFYNDLELIIKQNKERGDSNED